MFCGGGIVLDYAAALWDSRSLEPVHPTGRRLVWQVFYISVRRCMTQEDAAAFVARALVDPNVVGFILTFARHGPAQLVVWVFREVEGVLVEEFLT